MKKEKILRRMVICFAALLFVGCGNSKVDNKDEKDEKSIIVACANTEPPYSYIENGEHKGFEVDIWNEIAKRTGYEVKMETMGFSSIFGSLDSGKADVATTFLGETKERLEKYAASKAYALDNLSIAVLADNTQLYTIDDLKGKKVAVAEGSQGQAVGDELSQEKGLQLVIFENNSGLNYLSMGRSDAWMSSKVSLVFDSKKAGIDVRIFDEDLLSTNIRYYFRKNDKKSDEKRDAVDEAIQEMLNDGTLQKISEKWFQIDVTKGL